MEYLVVVSIGPVQSFIGSARKLEDFWSGSYLLSDITQRAIKIFMDHSWQSQQLIQPQLIKDITEENFDMAALPNRFLFKVKSEEDMSRQLKEIEASIRHATYLLLKEYVTSYFLPLRSEQYPDLETQIDEQLNDLLELYWAFVSFDETGDFANQRERLEENLASVKNIRQATYQVEYGLPCTLCGQHSALTKEAIDGTSSYAEMQRGIRRLWSRVDTSSRKRSMNEHLCAVCVAKRQQRTTVEQIVKEAQAINISQSGFPSVSYFIQDRAKAQKKANEQLTFDIQADFDPDVERYYAMVKFDGDNMGKWIASADSIREASDKTARLTNFAQKGVLAAKDDKHMRVVYSGGDDVLAVGNILDILRFTAELRENISQEELGIGPGLTGSAGIIIAPETYPLQSVIAMSNKAEDASKSFVSSSGNAKDAFSIFFIRRSGQRRQITLPFELGTLSSNLLTYVVETAYIWKQLKVSRNFIYHFDNTFLKLNHEYEKLNQNQRLAFYDNPKLIEGELRRLINNLSELDDRTYVEQLSKELTDLYINHRGSFLSFIQMLEIIMYLASLFESSDSTREEETHAI